MNTPPLSFTVTVTVTGCKNCPYSKHEFTTDYCDFVMPQEKCFDLYEQNFKTLTNSCPMVAKEGGKK